MGGDHDVDRVVTIAKTEREDLSTKNTRATANQSRACFGTTCWYACSNFVGAAGAWVFNAPGDCYGWWWFAASRLAAIRGGTAPTQKAETTSFCFCRGSERQHGHSHAPCE